MLSCLCLPLSLSFPPPPPSPAPAGLSGFDRRTGGFGGPTLCSIPTSTPSSKRSTGNRVWPWGHVWCWRPSCSRGRGWCKWSPHLHQQQQQQCEHHDFISLLFFNIYTWYLVEVGGWIQIWIVSIPKTGFGIRSIDRLDILEVQCVVHWTVLQHFWKWNRIP